MAADGIKPMRPLMGHCDRRDGSPMAEPPRFALARGMVRHVGEPIAAVIAETREQAMDAPSASSWLTTRFSRGLRCARRAGSGAPQLHAGAPGNVCFRWARGDEARVRGGVCVRAACRRAGAGQQSLDGRGDRAARACSRSAAAAVEKLTLYSSTQVPHHIRRLVAEQLGIW